MRDFLRVMLAAALVCAATEAAAQAADPAATVDGLYAYLLTPKTNIATDLDAQGRWLAPALSAQLRKSVATITAARKLPQVDGPDPKVPDNETMVDAWNLPTTCKAGKTTQKAGHASVVVRCDWGPATDYPGQVGKQTVTLTLVQFVWHVSDIRYHAPGKQYEGATLRQKLATRTRKAHALLRQTYLDKRAPVADNPP